MPATLSGRAGASGRLGREKKSSPLLPELASGFSKSRDLVVDLFATAFSTAMACFTVLGQRASDGWKAVSECFRVAEEAVLRKFAIDALDAGTDVELCEETAEAAIRKASVVPEVGNCGPAFFSAKFAAAVPMQNWSCARFSRDSVTGCRACCLR